MDKLKRKGFVLVLVIIAVILIGIVMLILTEGSKTMIFQSNSAYLEALDRNLVASGLAWAKQSINSENKPAFDKTIKLDVTDLNIRDAALSVCFGTIRDEEVEIELSTSCSRGRRGLQHNDKYSIQISHNTNR
jgi:hypothetical protein